MLDPWHVTGFIDGEGLFSFGRSGSSITLVFSVRTPLADRPLLESIREFFDGGGRIYRTVRGVSLRVTRTRELVAIAEHLDAYPLHGARRLVFDVWRRMLFIKAAHLGSRPPAELEALARELSRTTFARSRIRAPNRERSRAPTRETPDDAG